MLIGVANALLHVPMVCTFLSWFGFIPVAPGCLAEACSSQHNVSLVPGGIAEMTAYQGGSMLGYAISSARFYSENPGPDHDKPRCTSNRKKSHHHNHGCLV